MGCFRKGVFQIADSSSNPDVAIASEVSILSKNSLAITIRYKNFAIKIR